MQPFAIELNDRMLSMARAGLVLSSAPSASFDGTSGELLAADLARRLAEHHPDEGERVWIAAPARIDARGLSVVLDIARGLGLAVDGFVDSAAVTVAALHLERNALVLELGLHHIGATAVESGTQARRRRAVISEHGGLVELYEAWLDLISAAMVKRTRFDPLHDAATESQLSAALPAMMRELATSGGATASVTLGNERFDVTLSRDQFATAAQAIYREILRLLHELRPAGASVALVMPEPVATLPGLREALQQFVGCEWLVLADGFAAAATSVLDLPQAADEQVVRLLRRLPSREEPALAAIAKRELLGGDRVAGPGASHVLFDGKAYSLSGTLVVGRAPDATQSIRLPEGLAGVSRRHCTFVRDGGELVLVDHSHFGTFLNGGRVAERARVYAGDRVRLGDPGVELSVISLS